MRRCRLAVLALLLALPAAWSADLLRGGHARVVFVGDSITGLARNAAAGWGHQLDWALRQAHPDCTPDLVCLGGSGQGVRSWLNVEQRSRTAPVFLDIKGIDVQAALAKPADVLVVMLGMNDVLAPYVADDERSLADWLAGYRQLVAAVSARIHPGQVALATATPNTEDPAAPKNALMDKLNAQAAVLAKELGALVIPTNAAMWEVLRRGREGRRDFHVTYDFVHPNEAGHLAIATAMLRALGDPDAADLLVNERLLRLYLPALVPPVPPVVAGPVVRQPWRVAAGTVQSFWRGQEFEAAKAHGPLEASIEAGTDFTQAADVTGARLAWRAWVPTVDYTGLDAPGNVDFAGIVHARNFEAGYGTRTLRTEAARDATLNVSTQVFAGTLHLTVWLNGAVVYSGLLMREPGHKRSLPVKLKAGDNTLVFRLNHLAWQFQCNVDVE